MKNKKVFVSALIILSILCLLVIVIANSSYAYEYKNENYTLFYSDNVDELTNNIKVYISMSDDYLIPNSSYIYSDILTENYDFLVNFAIDYIYNNKEAYHDDIVNLDKFYYKNRYLEKKETTEYVDINKIYEITDNFFGIKDFVIINDNVKIIDNHISLARYNSRLFSGEIDKLNIDSNDKLINAFVYYKSGDIIKYVFKKDNNVLKLYNIEV